MLIAVGIENSNWIFYIYIYRERERERKIDLNLNSIDMESMAHYHQTKRFSLGRYSFIDCCVWDDGKGYLVYRVFWEGCSNFYWFLFIFIELVDVRVSFFFFFF